MTKSILLKDLIILLSATLPVSYIFNRFKLPVLMGYLLTGLMIGPFGIGLIHDSSEVEVMAEIGVVLLLFTIGLEFSLARMMQNVKAVIGAGSSQVLITVIGIFFGSLVIGYSAPKATFWGFLISLSSTAIILRIYIDRGELETLHGKITVGILLFQDLSVFPMMLLIPILSGKQGDSLIPVAFALVKTIIGVSLIFYSSRFFVPKLLHQFARLRNRESMILLVILLCLGIAFMTEYFGLSLAMGAFMAGLIISDSEYSQQIVVEILPFRDFFSSIFFISLGMLLSLNYLITEINTVVLYTTLIILLKIIFAFIAIWIVFPSVRISFVSSLRLANLGEFSFIMAGTALSAGLLSASEFELFISCAALSMFLAPALILASGVLPYWLFPDIRSREEKWIKDGDALEGHVVIGGYGLNGRNLTRVLKETRIKFLVLDINADHVKQGKADGISIMFGDVTRREILLKAGVKNAKIVVFAISDTMSTRRGVRMVKQINPNAYVLVRTQNTNEVDELIKLGANQVIPMEFETSVEIFSRVLKEYNLPANVINQYVEMIRIEGYGMLRGLSLTGDRLRDLYGYLAKSTTTNHMVMSGTISEGTKLSDLNLRNNSGAVILAIIRGNEYYPNPEPDIIISAGDLLVMAGSHAQLDKGQLFLSKVK